MEYKNRKEIIKEYLAGDPNDKKLKQNLAKKYNTTTRDITSIVNSEPGTNTEIEKKFFEIPLAKEQQKIHQVKMEFLEFFSEALKDASGAENKHLIADNLLGIFDKIDATQRLNEGKATEITEHKSQHANIDVAEVLKSLETPEAKRAFLLSGLNKT